jgi:hypothetical protein
MVPWLGAGLVLATLQIGAILPGSGGLLAAGLTARVKTDLHSDAEPLYEALAP